jgi:hypothetical protein
MPDEALQKKFRKRNSASGRYGERVFKQTDAKKINR